MEDTITIKIPADDEGFILQECPKCGEYFKLPASISDDEQILEIHCPQCGLVSENYFTKDVYALAKAKAENMVIDYLYDEMKVLKRKSRNSLIRFDMKKPKHQAEVPLTSSIDSMEIEEFECCGRQAKVEPLLRYCGCFCPYCGVLSEGNVECAYSVKNAGE